MKETTHLAVYLNGTLWLDGIRKRKHPEGAVAAMQGNERAFLLHRTDGAWEFIRAVTLPERAGQFWGGLNGRPSR